MSRPTTDLKDYELSLRRTIVPVIVGLVLAQAARANMTLPAEHVQGVVEAVFIMGYYALVRAVNGTSLRLGCCWVRSFSLGTRQTSEHRRSC